MPIAPIVVEVAPADSPTDLRAALLDACSHAVHDAHCVESTGDVASEPSVVAIVSWRDGAHVKLQVALRPEHQWVVREIDFDERNPPEERWRAVGLVIGTLAGEITRAERPSAGELPPPPSPPAPPEPAETQPEPPNPRPAPPAAPERRPNTGPRPPAPRTRATAAPERRVWVDAQATAGPALDAGPFRVGGELGARVRLGALPLDASVAASYSTAMGRWKGVHSTFVEGFAGFGIQAPLGRTLRASAHAEALAERVDVTLRTLEAGGPLAAGRWFAGARLRADLRLPVARRWEVFAGGGASALVAGADVRVQSTRVATVPVFTYALGAGASYYY